MCLRYLVVFYFIIIQQRSQLDSNWRWINHLVSILNPYVSTTSILSSGFIHIWWACAVVPYSLAVEKLYRSLYPILVVVTLN